MTRAAWGSAARRAAAAALLLAAACAPGEPRPLALNQDACAYCRMTISDARFGGEVVTRTGRIMTFDAVECLASWVRAADSASIAGVYTIDVQHPGTLVDATQAGYLRGALVQSPMGRSLIGFVSPTAAEQQRAMLGGTLVTWRELLDSAQAPSGARP